MKNRKIIGLFIVLIGLSLFLFPFFRMELAKSEEKKLREDFQDQIHHLGKEKKAEVIEEAKRYNQSLQPSGEGAVDPFDREDLEVKNPLESFGDGDVLGFIDIPAIDVHMPIFVGATKAHLAKGAATIDGTPLPFGGKGYRSVLAGHRGYYDFPAFLDVDELKEGDEMKLTILDQVLNYRVVEKEAIYPYEIEKLASEPDRDLLTLLTCHPYPANWQRLLIHGERVEEPLEEGDDLVVEETEEKAPDVVKVSSKITRRNHLFTAILIIGGLLWLFFFVKLVGLLRRK
ncbi:MAG: class C sortase [Tissierellia bacterium]|nr:class C sortase [Tissierellia bacterium]